jgi:hypothetical protein
MTNLLFCDYNREFCMWSFLEILFKKVILVNSTDELKLISVLFDCASFITVIPIFYCFDI